MKDAKRLARLGLLSVGIMAMLLDSTASAQKGGGGNSSSSSSSTDVGGGGGGGGGGGSTTSMKSITVPLNGVYYSVGASGNSVPKGTAVLSSDATGTNRTMSVSLTNVNVTDGTILVVVLRSNGLVDTVATPYYTITTMLEQDIADMDVVGGVATWSASFGAAEALPIFGTAGEVDIYALDPSGVNRIGLVTFGTYGPNKPGGRP